MKLKDCLVSERFKPYEFDPFNSHVSSFFSVFSNRHQNIVILPLIYTNIMYLAFC